MKKFNELPDMQEEAYREHVTAPEPEPTFPERIIQFAEQNVDCVLSYSQKLRILKAHKNDAKRVKLALDGWLLYIVFPRFATIEKTHQYPNREEHNMILEYFLEKSISKPKSDLPF